LLYQEIFKRIGRDLVSCLWLLYAYVLLCLVLYFYHATSEGRFGLVLHHTGWAHILPWYFINLMHVPRLRNFTMESSNDVKSKKKWQKG
jgi:hypothetical protein